MKEIAYPSFFLIELLVRCGLTVGNGITVLTVPCDFHNENQDRVARCLGKTIEHRILEPADLVLEETSRLFDVTILELMAVQPLSHSWRISNENMFTRFTKLVRLTVEGQLKVVDVDRLSAIETQLLNFPMIDTIKFSYVAKIFPAFPIPRLTLPQNVSRLILEMASIDLINWKKHSKLPRLRISDFPQIKLRQTFHLPEFSYPWLEELDIGDATSLNFNIAEIGFLCRLTQFTFNIDTLLTDACRCVSMKTWQEYLKNESTPLTIRLTGSGSNEQFNEVNCNPYNINCTNSEGILSDAKNQRAKCFEIVNPTPKTTTPPLTTSSTLNPNITTLSSTLSSTLDPNNTTPSSNFTNTTPSLDPTPTVRLINRRLLAYIVAGIVITAIVCALVAALVLRFYFSEKKPSTAGGGGSPSTAGGGGSSIRTVRGESEEEEAEEEPEG